MWGVLCSMGGPTGVIMVLQKINKIKNRCSKNILLMLWTFYSAAWSKYYWATQKHEIYLHIVLHLLPLPMAYAVVSSGPTNIRFIFFPPIFVICCFMQLLQKVKRNTSVTASEMPSLAIEFYNCKHSTSGHNTVIKVSQECRLLQWELLTLTVMFSYSTTVCSVHCHQKHRH